MPTGIILNMDDNFIDYGRLIDDAMHVIVKQALQIIIKSGLPGKHHFFISFLTKFPGVEVSEALKKKYPDEMTIVLQHQFENLHANEQGFGVSLSFDGIKERIYVPFNALVAFADPSVKFGLQFRPIETPVAESVTVLPKDPLKKKTETTSVETSDSALKSGSASETKKGKNKKAEIEKLDTNNVVSIDTFRKK